MKQAEPAAPLTTARIEALCDGIFAVAMTILVLNVTIPTAQSVAPQHLPQALERIGPQVLVYAISFVNLGVLWVGQHNQHHFIGAADRWFIWINIAFLMLISFIPFSTALLGQFPLERLAQLVYGVNVIAATLMLGIHWGYACSGNRLLHPHTSRHVITLGTRRIMTSACAYILALALSLINPAVSLILFLVVPFVNILPFRLDALLRPAPQQPKA